jgi:hypothetical protein
MIKITSFIPALKYFAIKELHYKVLIIILVYSMFSALFSFFSQFNAADQREEAFCDISLIVPRPWEVRRGLDGGHQFHVGGYGSFHQWWVVVAVCQHLHFVLIQNSSSNTLVNFDKTSIGDKINRVAK